MALAWIAAVCLTGPQPAHLREAEALLAAVKPEGTSYRHKPDEVDWKAGVCHTDCSGFISILLSHTYRGIDADWFKSNLGASRPLARHFYRAFVDGKGFKRIERVSEIEPGDFIAIQYEPGADNTGHIMLVAENPENIAEASPAVPNTTQVRIAVIDQTSSNHGIDDTRYQANGKARAGLGRGAFRLYVSRDGSVAGYAWSLSPKSKFYGPDTRALAIGRWHP